MFRDLRHVWFCHQRRLFMTGVDALGPHDRAQIRMGFALGALREHIGRDSPQLLAVRLKRGCGCAGAPGGVRASPCRGAGRSSTRPPRP